MEKRIELEKRGRPASQITDLNLDNCRSTNIVGLSEEFGALESLSLINVGLTTLRAFPNLPNLRRLELSDNRISNGLENLVTSPKLTYLNLSGNKIKDLETLKPLENFKSLKVLDLFNNPATSVENYREKTFAMLPSLKHLDGFDFNEVEASSDGYDDVSDTDDGESESDDESDNDDVSLAQLYNNDFEDDNSDWTGEVEESDEDDDLSDGPAEKSTEGEKDTSVTDNTNSGENNDKDGPSEESRGKKRKHDE